MELFQKQETVNTCLHCIFRLSRNFGYTGKSYCTQWPNKKSTSKVKLKRVKAKDKACSLFKKGKSTIQHIN